MLHLRKYHQSSTRPASYKVTSLDEMRSRAFSSGDSRREVAVSWSEHEQKFGGSDQENTRNYARNGKAHRSTAANNNSNPDASTAEESMNTMDPYTTEIVRVLFGPTIGAVLADCSCTYKRTTGRLYVATNALCFYSNIFSSESKYIFWFAQMAEVTKIKNSGVCISMKTNANGTADNAHQQLLRHNFRSFRDRDAVYQIISRLRLASPSSAIAGIPKATRPPPGRATTFDAASLRLLFPESQEVVGGDADITSSRLLTKSLSSISESSSFNKWSKKPKVSRRGRKNHRRIRSQSVDSFDVRRRADTGGSGSTAEGGSDLDSSDDEGHPNDTCNNTDDICTSSRGEGDEVVEDPGRSWLELKEQRLKETVLDSINLSCSLDEFYEKFIANDCRHSFGSFQKSVIGDFELEVKEWEKSKDSTATNCSRRTITFRHPLKHKLGPKDASMEKRQQLHLISGHGILLKSCTYGKGFPAADAFHVEDMWIIESCNADADESGRRGSGVSMSVSFQIQYSKSTMFKKMIDVNTKQEYTQMYDKYMDMVTSALGGEEKPGAAVAEKKIEDETPKVVLETSTAETPLLRMITLFAIAMISIWVLAYYISVLRSRIASLEEQMGEMRQNMLVLQELMATANDNYSPSSEAPLLTLL